MCEIDQALCEEPLTQFEMLQSVKGMANCKTPGSDGSPVEFYKFFWKDIGKFMYRSFCHGLRSGSLSISQKQGVITCMPKGDKPRQYLKNWRPITLLNVDYKILSACLANRMKCVLPQLISDSQTGFLKGRFIGENTRLVYDMIAYLEKKMKPGLLLLVDFEKAFDSLEWSFLHNVLNKYNFGEFAKKWVRTLYNDAQSCVINNGHFSRFFNLGRGCRQGDPLSPYLFILAIEPLAMSIKNNQDIKGITIGGHEHKIGQYADDTFLLLDGSERSLIKAMESFTLFEKCAGLRVNIDKTLVARLGTKVKEKAIVCPELKLRYVTEFTLLGIRFSTVHKKMVEQNLEDKIEKIKTLLKQYGRKNLSLMAKVTVVKTMALPQLVHILSVTPSPDLVTFRKIEDMFSKFIWNSKTGKVNRNLLAQEYARGGLKLPHLKSYNSALKIKWIKMVTTGGKNWISLFEEVIGKDFHSNIWQLDKKSIKEFAKTVENDFWRDVLLAWESLVEEPANNDDVLRITLWNSFFVTNQNVKTMKKHLIQQGCIYVNDLMTENGNFYSYNEFKVKYHVDRMNILDFYSLIKSIPRKWRDCLAMLNHKLEIAEGTNIMTEMRNTDKVCRMVYLKLVKKLEYINKARLRWEETLNPYQLNLDWDSYNSLVPKCSINTKLVSFQYKINQRILCTNRVLKRCNIKPDDRCTFCKAESETITHLLWDCAVAKSLWHELQVWLSPTMNIEPYLDIQSVLFGIPGSEKMLCINKIFLRTKYFIYCKRCFGQKPNIIGLKQCIRAEYELEKWITSQNGTDGKFIRIWCDFEKVLGL